MAWHGIKAGMTQESKPEYRVMGESMAIIRF